MVIDRMNCVLEDFRRMGAKRGPERPLLAELFTDSQWSALAEQFGLSRRQLDVARLICRGCTDEAIAVCLDLSGRTVRMHTEGLYRRVNVQSRLGLLVCFVEADRNAGQNGNAR